MNRSSKTLLTLGLLLSLSLSAMSSEEKNIEGNIHKRFEDSTKIEYEIFNNKNRICSLIHDKKNNTCLAIQTLSSEHSPYLERAEGAFTLLEILFHTN